MKLGAIAIALLAAVATANAQRHKITINAETPEGQLLQQIGQESDEAKKLALMEQFAAKYPKHEGAVWVWEQMIAAYAKANQYDKAVAAGDQLLAADPADAEDAFECLKAAEAKKDPDLVLKWSDKTSEAARKIIALPKPSEEDEVEAWKQRVDWAKQVDVRSEYSLMAIMNETNDPKKKIALGDALEKRNPQSQYLAQMAEQRFRAYIAAGDSANAVALAERAAAVNQATPEMLIAAASDAMAKKQPDKAIAMSTKAIETADSKPKPEGVADADWNNWKEQVTARAHWMRGATYASQAKWSQADHELRASLAGVKGAQDMLAEALFYLGLANYNLGKAGDTERIRDALKYFEQCAGLPGRFQANARTNVQRIRNEYRVR